MSSILHWSWTGPVVWYRSTGHLVVSCMWRQTHLCSEPFSVEGSLKKKSWKSCSAVYDLVGLSWTPGGRRRSKVGCGGVMSWTLLSFQCCSLSLFIAEASVWPLPLTLWVIGVLGSSSEPLPCGSTLCRLFSGEVTPGTQSSSESSSNELLWKNKRLFTLNYSHRTTNHGCQTYGPWAKTRPIRGSNLAHSVFFNKSNWYSKFGHQGSHWCYRPLEYVTRQLQYKIVCFGETILNNFYAFYV